MVAWQGGRGRLVAVVMERGTDHSHRDQDGVAGARGDEPRCCLHMTRPFARVPGRTQSRVWT